MSANFNIAMLRNIQQPLAESMEAIIAQLTRLIAGQIPGSELDQGQHTKLVRGGLEMIGCQAISRLAATLEKGCEALVMPERRGWDRARVEQVGKSLLLLAEGLDDQIKHMLVDSEDLPVRLWPVWAHVYEAMGEPVPTPEDLFEPDPNFEDEKFQPLALDYLGQVCEGMSERLSQALAQLAQAQNGVAVAKALREAERVFNWAYGLRHRRGYQAYWLVMRARMAIGLIQDPAHLEDKASWSVLLNEASVELQKFSKDMLRVRPDLLLKVIRPLLTPWPESWTSAHPALSEMDARMGLSVFWKTVAEVQDQKSQLAVSQFVAHQDELLSLLASLRSEWTRYLSGEGRASDPAVAKESVLAAVRDLFAKRMLFADPSAIVILEAISRVSEKMPHYEAVSEDMALEFASAVLVVEDSVERRGRVSPEFHDQSRIQQKRLVAAWEGNKAELSSLPVVRWDSKKQERQTRQALSTVFQEIRKDLVGVEEMLVENFRGEAGRSLDRDAMRDTLSLADAVLRTLMCEPASRVVRALVDRISEIPANGIAPQRVQDDMTLGITGLTSFLSARESGDEDAENLLSSAVQALLGQGLRKNNDPSLMIPPPEQEVSGHEEGDQPLPSDQSRIDDLARAGMEEDENEGEASDDASSLDLGSVSAEPVDDSSWDLTLPVQSADDARPTQEVAENAPAPVLSDKPAETDADADADADADIPEDRLNIMATEGMWDYPSRKEPDLVHFLLDEADSVLMEIVLQAGFLEHDPTNMEARQSLRRQFHTIKGSGRIAGVRGLAQVAWWIENMLAEDESSFAAYRPRVDTVVKTAHRQFGDWFQELRQNGKVWVQASELRQDVDAISLIGALPTEGEIQATMREEEEAAAETPVLSPTVPLEDFSLEEAVLAAPVSIDRGTVHVEGPLVVEEEVGDEADDSSFVHVEGLGEFESEMFVLFEDDARTHVEVIRQCLGKHDLGMEVDAVSLSRAAHTIASLAGGLGMSDLRRLGRSIENALDLDPEDLPDTEIRLPQALADASKVLADTVERVYALRLYQEVDGQAADAVDALTYNRAPADVAETAVDLSVLDVDVVDLSDALPSQDQDVNDGSGDEDALFDEIVDKMAEVTEKLQEAMALLIQLSERRR